MPNGALGVARRQRRSAPPRRGRRPDPRAGPGRRRPSSACVRELRPDVVGLSVMTFQRAHRAARRRARARAAARRRGSSSAATTRASRRRRTHAGDRDRLHRARRGRARRSASCSARSRQRRRRSRRSPACRIARRRRLRPQPAAARAAASTTSRSRCRTARARVLGGYTLLGRPVDVVETSRGCTFDCSFCSIIEMRGRNFHRYPIDRVLDDIARRAGATARGRSSSSTTTSRSTCSASRRCARRSSTRA